MVLKKKRDPMREALYSVYYVRNGVSKIDVLMDRIRSRRNRLLQIAADLDVRGESFLAKKYASEVAKLDKIYIRLSDIRLVLEKIALSLEYAVNMKKFEEITRDVYELLIDLRKIPESTIPEISLTLLNLEYSIKNIMEEFREESPSIEFYTPNDENVKKILEEARIVLKSKLEIDMTPESSMKV